MIKNKLHGWHCVRCFGPYARFKLNGVWHVNHRC